MDRAGKSFVWYECQECGSVLLWIGDDQWAYQKVGREDKAYLLKQPMTVSALQALLPQVEEALTGAPMPRDVTRRMPEQDTERSTVGKLIPWMLALCVLGFIAIVAIVLLQQASDVPLLTRATPKPTATPEPTPTPIPSPTSRPESSSTPAPTRPSYRWKGQVDDPLSQMNTETDQMTGVTWYSHKDFPWMDLGIYIAEVEGKYHLRLFIFYYADDWLFIDHYLVKADDQLFTIIPGWDEVERDVSGGGNISETYDARITSSDLEMIEAVALSENAMLRYVGDHRNSDIEISDAERNAMLITLAAFEELGGDLNDLPIQ